MSNPKDETSRVAQERAAVANASAPVDVLARQVPVAAVTRAALLAAAYFLDKPTADAEQAARERLGRWLAAEPGRAWDLDPTSDQPKVELYDSPERFEIGRPVATGTGPTLAAAIVAALDSPALASLANTDAALAKNALDKVSG